ncbi:cytochrome P450 [Mycena rebaudengoi]|nr:cytochrome P450 [Mycena rebaudengoi]
MAPLDIQGAILCASLAFGAVFYYARSRRNRSTLPLPPGPRKLPLVGNLLEIPADLAWEKYMEWSKEYNSDTIHLNLAGQSVIVLSSLEATEALLEKRSALYHFSYSYLLRSHPAALYAWFYSQRLVDLITILCTIGIDDIVGAVVVQSVAGLMDGLSKKVCNSDEEVTYAESILINFWMLIDLLPDKRRSSTGGRPMYLKWMKKIYEMKIILFQIGSSYGEWVDGWDFNVGDTWCTNRRLMSRDLPQRLTSLWNWQPLVPSSGVCWTALMRFMLIYATNKGVYSLVVAFDMFPALKYVPKWFPGAEFQRKAEEWRKLARAMVDVPYAETKRQMAPMPYVSALVKEVLRWKNVTPIRVPHFLATEDEYRGYRLPAGSIVIGSTWAILYDELMYPDPYAFKPERFLLDGKPNPAVKDPDCAAFRFGQMYGLPGQDFHLSFIIDTESVPGGTWGGRPSGSRWRPFSRRSTSTRPAGHVIELTFEYLTALVSAPLPFKCSITPRSNEAAKLIRGIVR